MSSAKEILVKPISKKDADILVKRWHYSGKVDPRSQLHFGVFLKGQCLGVMQFGPSIDKRKMQGLVRGSGWNEFMELNRMAFHELLPPNSESRALAVAMRLIRKHHPHIKWIISFADGAQCGDGTIYRASGFVLTQIKKNRSMIRFPDGQVHCRLVFTLHTSGGIQAQYGKTPKESMSDFMRRTGAEYIEGYQLRYIYFLDQGYRERLTVPEIPYSEIKKHGATMYRGKRGSTATSDRERLQLTEHEPQESVDLRV